MYYWSFHFFLFSLFYIYLLEPGNHEFRRGDREELRFRRECAGDERIHHTSRLPRRSLDLGAHACVREARASQEDHDR